jgi:uncharacterized protein YndB with AHSA1/START domain
MPKEVFATLLLPGITPDQLWPLLTEAGNLAQWFCEAAEVDLPGGVYRFWGRYTPDTPQATAHQTRLDGWTEPATDGSGGWLSFGWHLRGQDTHIELTLAPADGGTEIKVHHGALGERMNSKGALHDFWYSVLANLELYALTGRRQQLVEYGARPGTSLQVEVEIAAPAAAIFPYLIEPGFMARIWQDEKVQVEPRVGGVYDYGWETGGPRRILALDPPRLLSFSWLYPPETVESTVTWRLTDLTEDVTRLSLTHEGFPAGDDHEEYRAGWFSFLALIKGMVELGGRWSQIVLTGSAHGAA